MGGTIVNVFLICIVVLNVISFVLFGVDKQKAIKNKWRIPEKTLHISGMLGGLGAFLGMQLFRHKTKHTGFVLLVPVYALINVVIMVYLLRKMLF